MQLESVEVGTIVHGQSCTNVSFKLSYLFMQIYLILKLTSSSYLELFLRRLRDLALVLGEARIIVCCFLGVLIGLVNCLIGFSKNIVRY